MKLVKPTSPKMLRNSGFADARRSSWLSRITLTESDLSLFALDASFNSIWSKSSSKRYLSKSLPNCSDSYNQKEWIKWWIGLTALSSVEAVAAAFLLLTELRMNLICQIIADGSWN